MAINGICSGKYSRNDEEMNFTLCNTIIIFLFQTHFRTAPAENSKSDSNGSVSKICRYSSISIIYIVVYSISIV